MGCTTPPGQLEGGSKNSLGGGFKHFYVHPYLEMIPILTNVFQMGWNHQLNSCDRLGNLTSVSLMAWGLMSSEEEANFLANYLGDLEKKNMENDLGEFASSSYGSYGYGMVWWYCGCRIWICCFVDWPILQFGSGFWRCFCFPCIVDPNI